VKMTQKKIIQYVVSSVSPVTLTSNEHVCWMRSTSVSWQKTFPALSLIWQARTWY